MSHVEYKYKIYEEDADPLLSHIDGEIYRQFVIAKYKFCDTRNNYFWHSDEIVWAKTAKGAYDAYKNKFCEVAK
jgi:hypothetical protein